MDQYMMLEFYSTVPDEKQVCCKIQGIIGGRRDDFRVGDLVLVGAELYDLIRKPATGRVLRLPRPDDGDWAGILKRVEPEQ